MKTSLTLPIGLLLVLCFPNAGKAQNASPGRDSLTRIDSANSADRTYTKVEIESVFPGGSKAWLQFLNDHLVYPKKAVRKQIEGTVILQFIVDKNGSVTNLQALTGWQRQKRNS